MKMMGTSGYTENLAKTRARTMIVYDAMMPVAAVPDSVLISTANKIREQAQCNGDQAINKVASGFVFLELTEAENAFAIKEGCF
jgi:archaellin